MKRTVGGTLLMTLIDLKASSSWQNYKVSVYYLRRWEVSIFIAGNKI
jgi:hypothetical protein